MDVTVSVHVFFRASYSQTPSINGVIGTISIRLLNYEINYVEVSEENVNTFKK